MNESVAGKGVIITKFKQKAGGGGRASRDQGKDKKDSDALACMRVRNQHPVLPPNSAVFSV